MLLAIDTSAGTSVALVALDGTLLGERSTADTRRHAEVIGEYLHDLQPSGVSAVVVGVGPGPFTGLRVGIAAARGYALGASVPLWPILSHDAIAAARFRDGVRGPMTVATDARRRELFHTEYLELQHGVPVRGTGPQIVALAALDLPLATEVRAADLAWTALARLEQGLPFEPPQAVYLRSPDVTLSAPKRALA